MRKLCLLSILIFLLFNTISCSTHHRDEAPFSKEQDILNEAKNKSVKSMDLINRLSKEKLTNIDGTRFRKNEIRYLTEIIVGKYSGRGSYHGKYEKDGIVNHNFKNKPHAICKDGTVSYSLNDRGTCSYHDGVKVWIK